MSRILGIESSCDETAAAVVDDGTRIGSNVIASQHDLHRQYGGVVPEIASRAHLERIIPVIREALSEANATFNQIDAVAVGYCPGLIGSLLVGVSAAKAIAWALSKPLIGINHVRAHLYAAVMTACQDLAADQEFYPALGLVVSGGHSSLFEVRSPIDMQPLGRTIDDAVGEAYDKAAVILNLGYPGGPKLDKMAQNGDPDAFDLPRSLLGPDSLDFSFSGLKTALLYAVRGHPKGRGAKARFPRSADDLTDQQQRDLAASFQHAAVDVLLAKIRRAITQLSEVERRPRSLLLGGGVSANSLLRNRAQQLSQECGLRVYLPALELCLDNGAMIAGLAYEFLLQKRFDDLNLAAVATV